ncbi:MAG: rhodanese-like domain-containing protein [Planctomycetota bacterium]
MPFLTRVLLIGAAASALGIAHSWVIQTGDRPVLIDVELKSEGTVIDPSLWDAGERDSDPTGEKEAGGVDLPLEEMPDAGEAGVVLGLEISAAEAKLIFDAFPDAQFLDARLPSEYDEAHVQGAFYLTPDMLTSVDASPVMEFLNPEAPTIIYCVGGDCEASHNVAQYLQEFYGFTTLHIMMDGFPAWEEAGYPVGIGADLREAFQS